MIKDIKIGTDIQDIISFTKRPFSKNEKLYRRLFTKLEIDYCLSKNSSYSHFAARFAGKEALIKCVSDITNINFKNIEIVNNERGKPTIRLLNFTPGILQEKNFRISLSHTNEYATAVVIYLIQ